MKRIIFVVSLCLIFFRYSFSGSPEYELNIEDPYKSYFTVKIKYTLENEDSLRFIMPAWTPGSYVIENWAKNIIREKAFDENNNPLPFKKVDKQTWQVYCNDARDVYFQYQVYAYSRGTPYYAHLDGSFGYYNGAVIFMYLDGKKDLPVKMFFIYPRTWKMHTSLQDEKRDHFVAANYDELIDSPAFFGNLSKFEFEILGKTHYVVLNGNYQYNRTQISEDLTRMVTWFAELFGDLPYETYTFFLRIDTPARGGIEHSNSNISCITPASLSGDLNDEKYFSSFLMLECHEYFHLFNVKRIRPTGLGPFDYTKEVYTPMLWVSEGFTSYYTHRPLSKSGIVNVQKVYDSWANYYKSLQQNSALNLKSLTMYSFDAWLESGIPDYSFRVYYHKGALIALLLDIDMRFKTQHNKSIDGFFRYLYDEVYKKGKTFDYGEFLDHLNKYTGGNYSSFFEKYISGTEPIPMTEYLAKIGLDLIPLKERIDLGIRPEKGATGKVTVLYVKPVSPADELEISRGDEIIALNKTLVTMENWESQLEKINKNDYITLDWDHNGELNSERFRIVTTEFTDWAIRESPVISDKQKEFLKKWLLPGD